MSDQGTSAADRCKSVTIDLPAISAQGANSCRGLISVATVAGAGGDESPTNHRSPCINDITAENRGMSRRCLVDACRACLFGVLLVVAGCVIALLGFYSHYSPEANEEDDDVRSASNQTTPMPHAHYHHVSASQQLRSRFKLSYVGPILIGTGGFILIAVGVVVLELRDLSSKVFPVNMRRPATTRPRLTPHLLVEMFHTPTMKVVKQLARRAARMRNTASQTYDTRTLSWVLGQHLRTLRMKRKARLARFRSWNHLYWPASTAEDRASRSARRSARYAADVRIVVSGRSLSISCPQLDHVS